MSALFSGVCLSLFVILQDRWAPLGFGEQMVCFLLLIFGIGLFIDAKRKSWVQ
jgi:hypothetical protein